MKQTITVCDREGCKKDSAKHYQFFKERRTDAAGSSENWYYGFDLCVDHEDHFLRSILANFDRGSNYSVDREKILETLAAMKVKVTEE